MQHSYIYYTNKGGLQLVIHIITHTTFGFTEVILISNGTSYITGLEKG